QISRQVRGAGAFSDSAVVMALNLSADQKAAISVIRARVENDRGRSAGAMPQDRGLGEVLQLLTHEQVVAWYRLAGRPFAPVLPEYDTRPGPPPPGRGR
ncbi:MAG TPA: hypothetical protein VHM90_16330, partial [Phycisphaerae bacterium]|nr:hypothetical protein [Phycisphaerae bacterium]